MIKKYRQTIITTITLFLIILFCLFASVVFECLELHMYFGWKEIHINNSLSFKVPDNWESGKKNGLLYFYDKNEKSDNNIILFQSQTSECFQIGDSIKINEDNLLLHSCLYNASECVKYLLENNVDLSCVFGENPLCSAVENHNYEIAKMLIDGGVDINYADYEDYTPLMRAVDLGDLEIIKLLVNNGADIYYINEDGDSAVSIAEKEVSKNVYDYINSL